jgi:hypothetical protein
MSISPAAEEKALVRLAVQYAIRDSQVPKVIILAMLMDDGKGRIRTIARWPDAAQDHFHSRAWAWMCLLSKIFVLVRI